MSAVSQNSIILGKEIENEMLLVHDIFENVLTELNQAKTEDKLLNESITVLPSLFHLFENIVGPYICEELNPDIKEAKIRGISQCIRLYIKGIIPWKKFIEYANEPIPLVNA